jgi:hypothetical protein
MELDTNGIRIEHQQPFRSFLADLPNTAPFELPAPCDGVAPGGEPAPVDCENPFETLPEPESPEMETILPTTELSHDSAAKRRELRRLTQSAAQAHDTN